MNIKKIDKLVFFSFLGPYLFSFFIAEFTLVMQLMWKYADDILGKGLSILEILELMGYYAMTIIPMALPVSILVASVMVYGDLAEKFELNTLKSAGVSLIRVMRPGIVIALLTAAFSLFASNYLKPISNYRFNMRLDLIRKQKSSMAIEEGLFNDDFNNYVIRVGKKLPDGKSMQDVIIYDQSRADRTMLNMIKADSAQMYVDPSGKYFIMNLYKGYVYTEEDRKANQGKMSYPFVKTEFKSFVKILDMSEFKLDFAALDIGSNREDMLNTFQILESVDSLVRKGNEQLNFLRHDFDGVLSAQPSDDKLSIQIKTLDKPIEKKNDTTLTTIGKSIVPDSLINAARVALAGPSPTAMAGLKQKPLNDLSKYKTFIETIDSSALKELMYKVVSVTNSMNDRSLNTKYSFQEINRDTQRLLGRMHQQYSHSFICLVFMFIGAPLGSIIRKGGYGYPLLVSILFYMVFMISFIMGTKLLKSGMLSGFVASWFPVFLLLPFAVYFTTKALNDSRFEAISIITSWVKKRFSREYTPKVIR